MIIPDKTIDSIVCIRGEGVDGQKYILGSGFVYSICYRKKGKNYIHNRFLITCKHVIEGYDKILISFGNSDDEIELPILKYSDGVFTRNQAVWFDDISGEFDIAVILFNPDIIMKKCKNYKYFLHGLLSNQLKEKKISEGDSIFIMGFPQIFKTHREEELKVLISRHGSIANIKDLFSKKRIDFIVDSLVYPGNSGGPVLLNPIMNTSLGYKDIKEPLLIGMVTNYYAHREKAFSDLTSEQKVLFEDNSGLVSCYPLDMIHKIVDYANSKLKEHISTMVQLVEKIDSEDDLREFFVNFVKRTIKSQINSGLKDVVSEDKVVAKLINRDIDKNKDLEKLLFSDFKRNNFESGIGNLRSLFGYEYIDEFISKDKAEKILELLNKWEEKLKD